ncbi:uncharacterized protein L969DRAFT_69220 [Mixia osmundae IAM 14324]|uniref:uncharacterized protein n=1 Tax=Mixia osmundae (strain CBS 9802 / IAM 14324 / JCM 22182 / KY 12970) TaxID=764103 RepID=UPI0004A54868|nr:uncharacterized protein L969DRAFT_69220 [Mixia osmundae IAM 14324]KEI42289.1 hypothetical protein L969DRAFT_69220 [Mixia osmundae IAM 14324]
MMGASLSSGDAANEGVLPVTWTEQQEQLTAIPCRHTRSQRGEVGSTRRRQLRSSPLRNADLHRPRR